MFLREVIKKRPKVLFVVTSFDEVVGYVSDLYRQSVTLGDAESYNDITLALTKSKLSNLNDMSVAPPWTASRWLVEAEYTDIKGIINKVSPFLSKPQNMSIVVRFQRREYMDAKKLAQEVKAPMYWGDTINRDDVLTMFAKEASNKKISQNALKYLAKEYYSSPEKVIHLKNHLEGSGSPVNSPADVRLLIGYPAKKVDLIVDNLLRIYSKGGSQKITRDVFQDVNETVKIFNRLNSMRISMEKVVEDYILIQDLYMDGVLYKDMRNDLKRADLYEEYWPRLRWYSWKLETICSTSLGSLHLLGSRLTEPWVTKEDVILFLGRWVKDCEDNVF